MAGIPIPLGGIIVMRAKYWGTHWKRNDTLCHGALKIVKINYEPRKWWQFWKKKIIVSYNAQRIK